MLTDIEIARRTKLEPIKNIAEQLGIGSEDLESYGHYKAKVSLKLTQKVKEKTKGKLILVTAVSPTPAGEGKTTTTVGLGQALSQLNKKVMICLREPSLGPCMGIKGGAAGGGYSQVVPMEDINLHFTGDFHAITSAHNLLAAMVDNHIQQGNRLHIDPRKVVWNHVMDMNDRTLRHIVVGLGGKANGIPRESSFDITVASEIMAIFCLATSISDLKERLGRIIVAYTFDGKAVTAADIHAQGAMTALLKDAIKPNLVQTLEHVPAFIHGGPSAVVLVATIRALKMNGGKGKQELTDSDPEAVRKGLPNLERHISNLKKFGLPIVVALNLFPTDTLEEKQVVYDACARAGVDVADSDVFMQGGKGGLTLASKVIHATEQANTYAPLYDLELPIKEKIEIIAKKIYGAAGVQYDMAAEKALAEIKALGFEKFPVCIAKTPVSFSDDPTQLGAPSGFTLHVRDMRISAGAGFIVVLTGKVMTMPGLPKLPAAERIDVDEEGNITGLF